VALGCYDQSFEEEPSDDSENTSFCFASSAESVGRFWLRKFSELVKQGDLDIFKRLKAIGFSHGQFRFVVEVLSHQMRFDAAKIVLQKLTQFYCLFHNTSDASVRNEQSGLAHFKPSIDM